MAKIELINHFLMITNISYLKPLTCVQMIYIRNTSKISLLMLNYNTWNHLTGCKQKINIK